MHSHTYTYEIYDKYSCSSASWGIQHGLLKAVLFPSARLIWNGLIEMSFIWDWLGAASLMHADMTAQRQTKWPWNTSLWLSHLRAQTLKLLSVFNKKAQAFTRLCFSFSVLCGRAAICHICCCCCCFWLSHVNVLSSHTKKIYSFTSASMHAYTRTHSIYTAQCCCISLDT